MFPVRNFLEKINVSQFNHPSIILNTKNAAVEFDHIIFQSLPHTFHILRGTVFGICDYNLRNLECTFPYICKFGR